MKDQITAPGSVYSDQQMADMFAALSHPARIRIVRHLARHAVCNCKTVVEEVGLAQSTVSQHLKVLVEAGLVCCSPKQQQSCYSLAPVALDILNNSVNRLAQECCACGSSKDKASAHEQDRI